jgi:hypothetical protein
MIFYFNFVKDFAGNILSKNLFAIIVFILFLRGYDAIDDPVFLFYYKKGALDSQPQVIQFTRCLPGGSLRVLRLLPPITLVAMI